MKASLKQFYLPLKMKSCSQVSGTKLYAITCDPLPSHIRTIFLATEKHKTEYPIYKKSILKKLSTTLTRRAVVLTAITLLFCVAITSLAVSVAIEISRKPPPELAVELPQNTSSVLVTEQESPEDIALLGYVVKSKSSRYNDIPLKGRTPCLRECWAYAAFRFKAQCVRRKCVCNADQYNYFSCLPNINECSIKRNVTSRAEPTLDGVKQTLYSCRKENNDSENVHVVSVYGNHYADMTTVNVTGLKRREPWHQPVTLVVTSYKPISWKIHISHGIEIRNIIIICSTEVAMSEVIIVSGNATSEPIVSKMLSPTGYGEDRYEGQTVNMIRFIEARIGSIRTYQGAQYADDWALNLGDNNENELMDNKSYSTTTAS